MISDIEFKHLSTQGYNRIPLQAQAFADLETPLSLYLKLTQNRPYSFLLESVVGGERFGRYSFIGLPARSFLRASGFGSAARTEVVTDGVVVEIFHSQPVGPYHAGLPKAFFSKSRCSRVCRVSVAVWPGISATTQCVTSRKNWHPAVHLTN